MLDKSPYILYIHIIIFTVFFTRTMRRQRRNVILLLLFFFNRHSIPRVGPTEIAINRNTRTKCSVTLYDIILLFVHTYIHTDCTMFVRSYNVDTSDVQNLQTDP